MRAPVHLCRGPSEPTNQEVAAFYDKLLPILKLWTRFGTATDSSDRSAAGLARQLDSEGFVSFASEGKDEGRYVAVINYGADRGQCYLRLPFPELEGRRRFSRI